jgi:hypothetical protein
LTENRPTLTVIGGPHDGTTLRLDAQIEKTLGSGSGSSLKLELTNVAAVHARLVWDGRGLVLRDAGSETGTYVNGERLTAARVLADGDRIFLGPPGSKNTAKLLATGVPAAGKSDAITVDLEKEKVILHDPEGAAVRAPGAAAGARPAAAPASKATATPAKAEYSTELPSIAPADRVREELPELPPAAPSPARKAAQPRVPAVRIPELPRGVWIGLAAAVLAGGGLFAFLALRPAPPVLSGVTPTRVEPGQSITLTGTSFAPTAERNAVRIGDALASIKSASETQIAATVPDSVPAGEVEVRVEREGRGSNALSVSVFRPPRIDSLEPDVAMPGAEVVASGLELGEGAVVVVGGQNADVVDTKPGQVRFRVPAGVQVVPGQGVTVSLSIGNEHAKPATLFVGQLPLLLEAVPPRGEAGERVVLKGRGFDPNPSGNIVTFGERQALVLQASAKELTVAVPGAPGRPQFDLPIVVRARGGTSTSPVAFALVQPSLGSYAPRYFPEPAAEHPGHDHAFVACELGPVLLLTGKADAASTAERAARVAAALNALAERNETIAFEAQAASVRVAGRSGSLVTATEQDGAGYGEGWGAGGAVQAPTPERLAAYWAALLQDHRLLFFQNDRPVKVLELSPRGKALSSLYAEAVRRSGPGQGVPAGIVASLTPQAVRELRDLALLAPADAGGAAAARAVEGLWQGTMAEAGVPEKALTVRLRMQGGSLAGTLTTRVGKVAMDVPLQGVSYQQGVLKFTAATAGASRQFSGTLQGDTLSGTMQAPGGPAGRFTLKYLQ